MPLRLSNSKLVIAGLATSIIIFGLVQYFGLKRKSGITQVSEALSIRVPMGFTVEKVAGSGLVAYPMLGTLDDRGRLFLCESSGKNVTTEEMTNNPEFRIRLLEDLNGDGIFDRSQVFADKLTMPAGAVWYRKSLFVAAPPDLLRFDDTDDDGVADRREVVLTGWNLSSNAASLHGPFLGPDGWLYLTDGRHGYKIKTKEGTVFEGKASRIWRCRPDGSGLEWVSGGGFDNPVELVFTPAGETIGTMTYFTDPKNGQRDALLHFVEGGVYPKWHSVVAEFKRTGDLMPVMTKFARIAPCGLLYYRGKTFGSDYLGNLFSAQFNPHRVQRHKLFRQGATFRTEDEDFLTSSNPDFHPTDVIEDADGSLLVVDTGAWFIHGCPISRTSKPQIRGAIYRVRKSNATPVQDPWGKSLGLDALTAEQLVRHLEDPRAAVQDRSLELLVEAGERSVSALERVLRQTSSSDVRCAAVFGLGRIASASALQAVRSALDQTDFVVRIAAARMLGLARDRQAAPRLVRMAKEDQPAVRRQAATALGQIGATEATAELLASAANPEDRFVEHALIDSLIRLRQTRPLTDALTQADPKVRKAALIVLDQMSGSPLTKTQAAHPLADQDAELRHTALWVITHHPDWADAVLVFLQAQLRSSEATIAGVDSVREALLAFCSDTPVQNMVASVLESSNLAPERQLFLLDVMNACSLTDLPEIWIHRLSSLLQAQDARVRLRAVSVIRSRGIMSLDEALRRIAFNASESADVRTAAFGALVDHHPELSDAGFRFLLEELQPTVDADLRLLAAQVLGKAALKSGQLLLLANQYLPQADALVLSALLDAFRTTKDETVGKALVAALLNPKVNLNVIGSQRMQQLLRDLPESVQLSAGALRSRFKAEEASRNRRLQELQSLLTAGGDVGHGRSIFFGKKVACSSCHTIGAEGGHVGPDLTSVGSIRSGHDLLEAIVFPSASFVPGHEIYRVRTKSSKEILSGVLGDDPNVLVLVTGPNAEVRIPRDQIASMERSTVSLMPEGLDTSLTQQEFTDLLAFLQAQRQ